MISAAISGCAYNGKNGNDNLNSVPDSSVAMNTDADADAASASDKDTAADTSDVMTDTPSKPSGTDDNHGDEPYMLDFVDVFSEHYQVMIDPSFPMHKYSEAGFDIENDLKTYEDDSFISRAGIDVSKYQGHVDYDKLKDIGIEFVFIRLGYRGYGKSGVIKADPLFEENFVKASEAGFDVGVYFFSQAINEQEALEEADFVLDRLNSIKEKYPEEYEAKLGIVYDPESILDDIARTDDVTREQFTLNALAFLERINDNGYKPIIYCNMLWEAFMLDMGKLYDHGYSVWYADYEEMPQTPYEFEFWQYTNEGRIDGINGGADIDIQMLPKSNTH